MLICRKAWFAIDLGVWLLPTCYSLRHARGYGRSALRNWLLQVSKDSQTWVTLFSHADDTSLIEPGYKAMLLVICIFNYCWNFCQMFMCLYAVCMCSGLYDWIFSSEIFLNINKFDLDCTAVVCEVVCCMEVRPGPKKGKWGGTSEGRDENGKMDMWCEVTR